MSSEIDYRNIDAVDWKNWTPTEEATLCFIRSKGRLLLMNKKTGMGTGLINAPGGRIEEGETPMEGAVRETIEEVRVTPRNLFHAGELYFHFTDGYKLKGYVFLAHDYEGEPGETEEAEPFWVSEEEIPFDKMWEDDRFWIPLMLEGWIFKGYFIFNGEKMVSFRIEN